jgi:RNA polymerase sigma-70 factor (ECF subfamily)
MEPEDPTRLVTRASAGDVDAFGALVSALEPSLRGYIARMVGARPIVDDILQETFLRLWRGLAWLRDPALFRPWSFRIATRETQRALGRELKREALRADASALEGVTTDFTDPAVRLDIEACLPQLTPQARIVLVAHYFEGLTLEEIASATRAPLGTVKSRLASGLAQLRTLLGSSR